MSSPIGSAAILRSLKWRLQHERSHVSMTTSPGRLGVWLAWSEMQFNAPRSLWERQRTLSTAMSWR